MRTRSILWLAGAAAAVALLEPRSALADGPKVAEPAGRAPTDDGKAGGQAAEPSVAAPPPAAGSSPEAPPAWETAKATRRDGFMVGVTVGFGLTSVAGFPNDVTKIERQPYYTTTGVVPGSTFALWLGGALTDWLDFGVGFGGGAILAGKNEQGSAGGLLFHLEAFPLFPYGGRWRDVGVQLEAGTGTVTLAPKSDPTNHLVDSGSASSIGIGAFYDGVRFWRFGSGPVLFANYMWSDSVRRPGFFLGWRTALYTAKIQP